MHRKIIGWNFVDLAAGKSLDEIDLVMVKIDPRKTAYITLLDTHQKFIFSLTKNGEQVLVLIPNKFAYKFNWFSNFGLNITFDSVEEMLTVLNDSFDEARKGLMTLGEYLKLT